MRKSTIDHPEAGFGLFAVNKIAKGATIAEQENPRLLSGDMEELRARVRDSGCPDDSIVWLRARRNKGGERDGYWDQDVVQDCLHDVSRVPKWYRMNTPDSTREANVSLVHDSELRKLLWVAKEVIDPGDELFWIYGMTKDGVGDE